MGKIDYAFKVGDTVRGNGHRYPSMIIERCNINGINYYHLDGVNKKELFKEDDLCLVEHTREKVNICFDTGDILTLRNGDNFVLFNFFTCDEWVAVNKEGKYIRSKNYSWKDLKNCVYSELDIVKIYRLKDRINIYDVIFNLQYIDDTVKKYDLFKKIYDEETDVIDSILIW